MTATARALPPGVSLKASSAVLLAAWVDDGRRGIVDVQAPAGTCRLHVIDGALQLDAEDPLAGGATGPMVDVDLEPLIALLGSATVGDLRFTPRPDPTPRARSLPTAVVLMETAVRGRDRSQLWTQIGGRNVALRMGSDSALAADAMTRIAPRLQALLARFLKPRRPAELIEDDPAGLELLRDVARLVIVGLLARSDGEVESTQTALSDRSRELFLRRIEGELERKPLRINSEEHRRKVIELLHNVGVLTHYELLGVGRHQDEQAIHQAYVEVARLAHPSHAQKLGLGGKTAALDLLFDAATEAYLVLSHPDRRRDYDRELSPEVGSAPASEERRREKASIAKDLYGRARRLSMEHDFQGVFDLMQQAVQLDPKAEYYALLGQVQRRNPQWKAGAVASFRDAVRCRPDDADLRFSFAQILEEMGDRKQAGVQYRAALELRPKDLKLQEALELFENPLKPPKKSSGSLMASLRALLRRGERPESEDRGPARAGRGGKARPGKIDWTEQSTTYEIDLDKDLYRK
ncbi:MAG TPA: DnaJ domain-containing protein [Thermoanaerobaculia bacterium]|nr:DnaJ domain-containing protein [Thermoanaerobaculia bacterium]